MSYTEIKTSTIKEAIFESLHSVIDPELGIDIINLGLVYDIRFQEDGATEIDMTLTTMGCPLADLITDQIHDALKTIPEITKIDVRLVWEPVWSVKKMSRYARIALGIR
ncbi:metal-sulfur cluster assembly factor [Streptococcus henryi]|uniref:metal-sulfur cluster assembly factor n=1 Tax=Streptococcus henryi TaxID=439219 RepID=UPI000380AEFF|nr:metal-sulfur cluster assembly factor [Streptococcus henryi]